MSAQADNMGDATHGTCGYCGEECGPISKVCVACTMNPKRRRRYTGERNAPVHIEDDDE